MRIEQIVTTVDLWSESDEWLTDVCRGADTIIHVAWYSEPGRYLQSPKNLECLAGTLRLAQAASQAKVRRFVGIGTCFEYDFSAGLLSIDTPMTKAQKDKLSALSRQVKIELCYTNRQADAAFWASFGTEEMTLHCPRPPQEGRVVQE